MDKFEALLAKSKANTPAPTVAEPINTFDAVLAKRTSLPAVEPRALSLGDRLLASVSQVAPVQAVLRSDPRQTALDIGGGLTRAGAGLYDLGKLGIETIGYPVSQPIEYLKGIPAEERSFQKALTFPTYSAVEEGLKEIAEPRGLEPKSFPSRLIEYGTAGVPGLIGGLTMEGGAKIGEVVGGETGKAIGGAIGTIAGVFAPGASKNAMKKGAKLFESLDTRAQKQVLDLMTPDEIEKLKLAQEAGTITSTVNVPKTLAEVTESPSIAAQQAALESTTTPITSTIKQRKEALTEVAETTGRGTTQGEFQAIVNDVVDKQVANKAAAEGKLLESIETPSALDIEEKGIALRTGLESRRTKAKKVVDDAWGLVGSDAAVDISKGQNAIEQIIVDEIAAERYADLPNALQQYIAKIQNIGDVTSWKQLDEVRRMGVRTYGKIANNADAKRIFNKINDEYLGAAKNYADEIGSPEYKFMSQAVDASRNYFKTFQEKQVGKALAKRFDEYKTYASDLVKQFTSKPERIKEIGTKFGNKTDEMVILRQTLLENLEKQAPNKVVAYLNDKNKIVLYKAAFKDDFDKVQQYAAQKAQDLPIEQWAVNSLSEAALPNKIFQSKKSVQKFMNDFAGTDALEIAKNKFVNRMMARGDINTRTAYYNEIGKELFGKDWEFTQQLLKDLESIKAPNQLLKTKAAGGSATETRQAVRKTLDQSIAEQNLADRAPTLGAWIGATFGSITGSPRATIAAGATGKWLGEATKTGLSKRAERMRTAMAQLFADPRLIDLAKKPATEENIKALDSMLQQLAVGRGIAMSMRQEEGE